MHRFRVWCFRTAVILLLLPSGAKSQSFPQIIESPRADIDFGRRVEATDSVLLVTARWDTAGQHHRGSVFVYERGATGWASAGRLTLPDSLGKNGVFGRDVALARVESTVFAISSLADSLGNHLVVFRKDTSDWSFHQDIRSPQLGQDFDAHGGTIVASRSGDVTLQLFEYRDNMFVADSTLSQDGFWLGQDIKMYQDVIVSSEWSFDPVPAGVVTFRRTNGVWSPINVPTPMSTSSGASTSLSGRSIAVVTNSIESEMSLYGYDGSEWQQDQVFSLQAPFTFAITAEHVFIGSPFDATNGDNAGAVQVWQKVGPEWQQKALLFAPNAKNGDRFGRVHESIRGSDLFVSSDAGGGTVFAFPLADIVNLESTLPGTVTGVQMYPNPALDFVTINFRSAPSPQNEVYLYDMMGRLLLSVYQNYSTEATIDTSKLPAGSYIVVVRDDHHRLISKVLTVVK